MLNPERTETSATVIEIPFQPEAKLFESCNHSYSLTQLCYFIHLRFLDSFLLSLSYVRVSVDILGWRYVPEADSIHLGFILLI